MKNGHSGRRSQQLAGIKMFGGAEEHDVIDEHRV
jgi:hypothetical protein